MNRELELQTMMKRFWQSIAGANDELNTFINAGLPQTVEKRHKAFVRRWDDMKARAEALYDEIEQLTEADVEPVEITLPWEESDFAKAWQEWKDYLAEQHHRHMKSRMERAALAHLKKLTDGKEAAAIEYLQFAMANGYPRFFKVTTKNYEQPTINDRGRDDGDY